MQRGQLYGVLAGADQRQPDLGKMDLFSAEVVMVGEGKYVFRLASEKRCDRMQRLGRIADAADKGIRPLNGGSIERSMLYSCLQACMDRKQSHGSHPEGEYRTGPCFQP